MWLCHLAPYLGKQKVWLAFGRRLARLERPFLLGKRMTAQQLTRSSSKHEFKVFKQTLHRKNTGKADLHRRDVMAYQDSAGDPRSLSISREQVTWLSGGNTKKGVGVGGTGRHEVVESPLPSAVAIAPASTTPSGTCRPPAKVEREEGDTRPIASATETMVVAGCGQTVAATSTDMAEDAAVGVSVWEGVGGKSGGGDAIPVSPASPGHEAAPTDPTESQAVGNVGAGCAGDLGKAVQSPASGGVPATSAGTDKSKTPPPSSGMLAETPAGVIRGVAATGTGVTEGSVVVPRSATTGHVRLGRGRKLCPKCGALTKSAVKQCRECDHVFSPASSRSRAVPRLPKENEDVITSRRRSRPSQRLMEYACDRYGSSAASGSTVTQSGLGTRRPLAASTPANGGGGANHIAASGAGGGRPAAADDGMKKLTPNPDERSVKGTVEGPVPPKRTPKRKTPVPPGNAPQKRKKNTAGNARAGASTAQTQAKPEPEPVSTQEKTTAVTALEQDADSQGLTPVGPTVVPPATAAEASMKNGSLWALSQQNSASLPRWIDAPLPMASVPSQTGVVSASPQQAHDVIDVSEENQNKDPFEGVELRFEEERSPEFLEGEVGAGVSGGWSTVHGAVGVGSTFPVVEGDIVPGGGVLGQHSFSFDATKLVGDMEMIWSPLRSWSLDSIILGGGGASSVSHRNSPPPPDFECVAAMASTATSGMSTPLSHTYSAVSSASSVGSGDFLHGFLGESGPGLLLPSGLPAEEGEVCSSRVADTVVDHVDLMSNAGGSSGGGVWNPAALPADIPSMGIGPVSSFEASKEAAQFEEAPASCPLPSTVVGLGSGSFAHAVAS